MANTIKVKRSATQGAQPTTGQLDLGEIAINTYDGKMFIKKDNGTASIVEIGAGGGGGGGISTLNTLTAATQTFATGTTGTDFAVSSSTSTHTFNLPDASTTARGVVTTGAQSITGTKTFTAATASDKGLIVKGAASQTANLLEVQNSSATSLVTVNNTGLVGVNENTLSAQMHVTAGAATRVPFVIKGAASQSANFLEVQDNGGGSGGLLFRIAPQNFNTNKGAVMFLKSGQSIDKWMAIGMAGGSPWSAVFGHNAGGEAFSTFLGAVAGFRFTGATSGYNVAVGTNAMAGSTGTGQGTGQYNVVVGYDAGVTVRSGSNNTFLGRASGYLLSTGGYNTFVGDGAGYNVTTGAQNVVVGGTIPATAATASYQVALGRSATTNGDNAVAIGRTASAEANCFSLGFGNAIRMSGDANGQIGINETTPGAQLHVTSGAAARKGQIIKLAATPTANALEVQNSSGTAIFAVDQTGAISTIGSTGLVSKIQNGEYIWLGTTGGTSAAQTASATPALTAYAAGQKFRMKIGSGLGSTGSTATAHTLNVNSLGAKNIVNNEDGTNPTLGTWVAGAIMEVVYDGTNFVITNDPSGWLTYTPVIAPVAGTATSQTFTRNSFRKVGKRVTVCVYASWTQNTSTASYVNCSLPVDSALDYQITGTGGTIAGPSFVSGFGYTVSNDLRCFSYNQSHFPTGSNVQLLFNFSYSSV